MDFLVQPGIIAWMIASFFCLGLGTVYTLIERQKHARRSSPRPSHKPERNPRRSRVCSACEKPTDDPGACWCWFCGQPLSSSTRKPLTHAQGEAGTRFVDIHAIDEEIRQMQARTRRFL